MNRILLAIALLVSTAALANDFTHTGRIVLEPVKVADTTQTFTGFFNGSEIGFTCSAGPITGFSCTDGVAGALVVIELENGQHVLPNKHCCGPDVLGTLMLNNLGNQPSFQYRITTGHSGNANSPVQQVLCVSAPGSKDAYGHKTNEVCYGLEVR